ncbi:MAG: methionyl-tRNA formyltransferase [Eubacteriales bacterium]|jgi:methionyl-tRNA formyltransferase|nr:methionyl-tRNA formyltransferase [Eubacteriales bacterium]MCI6979332.1 methionyl-tRNA formyltransferase [Clostridiales bacterium]
MKIAFLGTPDFALPSLKMLYERGDDIVVFTQPDKPVGRKAIMTAPPVKKLALEYGLDVFQFDKIRSEEGLAALKDADPELMVTAAFGQILSKENLSVPRYGCINVHGSLLPKYRGAAPIQWAVINGEEKTGVTTMLTDIGLDTGDILLERETEIGKDETAGELFDRLAEMGAELLKETIEKLERNELEPKKQNDAEATKCSMIKKEHGHIDFSKSEKAIHDLVRGMNPWPCAYAMLEGEAVKIWRTRRIPTKKTGSKAGSILCADKQNGLIVKCGDGDIEILELQFPGSKRMSAQAAMLGHELVGKVFD